MKYINDYQNFLKESIDSLELKKFLIDKGYKDMYNIHINNPEEFKRIFRRLLRSRDLNTFNRLVTEPPKKEKNEPESVESEVKKDRTIINYNKEYDFFINDFYNQFDNLLNEYNDSKVRDFIFSFIAYINSGLISNYKIYDFVKKYDKFDKIRLLSWNTFPKYHEKPGRNIEDWHHIGGAFHFLMDNLQRIGSEFNTYTNRNNTIYKDSDDSQNWVNDVLDNYDKNQEIVLDSDYIKRENSSIISEVKDDNTSITYIEYMELLGDIPEDATDEEIEDVFKRKPEWQTKFRKNLDERSKQKCEFIKNQFLCIRTIASHTVPVAYIVKLVRNRKITEEEGINMIVSGHNGFYLNKILDDIYDSGWMTIEYNNNIGKIKLSDKLKEPEWSYIMGLIDPSGISVDGYMQAFLNIHNKYVFLDNVPEHWKELKKKSDEFVKICTPSEIEDMIIASWPIIS